MKTVTMEFDRYEDTLEVEVSCDFNGGFNYWITRASINGTVVQRDSVTLTVTEEKKLRERCEEKRESQWIEDANDAAPVVDLARWRQWEVRS